MRVLPFLVLLLAACGASASKSIHTVITTECTPYFSWQTLGMFFSHKRSGQPGPITRIMCCTPEEYEKLPDSDRNLVPTHVAPSYTHHPRLGDVYSAYNKPLAIIDWLAKNDVEEEYVLVIDADMIMRTPFTAEDVGAKPGTACAAYFGYMKGVKNALATKHVPYVKPRNDTIAGPRGRRGDQCGGFTLMHREDLRKVGPHWLKFTEKVRFDPDAWELSGDAYSTHKGDRPWISEMYGYSYGCATADVWHTVHHTAMLYPGYDVSEPPHVLHYGLLWSVPGTDYSFDKHWFYQFNPLVCPPWEIGTNPRQSRSGLFATPPHPRSFKTTGTELLRDLMAVEVPITLNAAFCERHRRVCPPSDELEQKCSEAEQMLREFDQAFADLEQTLPDPCRNQDPRCPTWALAGECETNQGFMFDSCPLSCDRCQPRAKRGSAPVLNAIADDGQQQADPASKRQQGLTVTDSIQRLRGGALHDAAVQTAAAAKELRRKCTGHLDWTKSQVNECLRLAARGKVYKPLQKDGGDGVVASQQRAADSDGQQAAVVAGQGEGGGEQQGVAGEQGQRKEKQLHEDDEVLKEQAENDGETAGGAAGGGADGDGLIEQAAKDALLDEGRLLGEAKDQKGGLGGTRGTVKRLGEDEEGSGDGTLGVSRLGLFGVLLWGVTLTIAFLMLPCAKKAVGRGGRAAVFLPSASPYSKKGGRDD